MTKKRRFILAATLLALFSSPLLHAFEDCGTSVTECKLWQAINALQEQTAQLEKENQTQQNRIAELEKENNFLVPTLQRWNPEQDAPASC